MAYGIKSTNYAFDSTETDPNVRFYQRWLAALFALTEPVSSTTQCNAFMLTKYYHFWAQYVDF